MATKQPGNVGQSSAAGDKDWKKFVVINPINVLIKENKEDGKGISNIDILNKSQEYIMFKIKTTEPNNYIVRPN
jgi:hypothetical protein